MSRFLSALLLSSCLVQGSTALSCYVCASNELQSLWQVTGFPKMVPADTFIQDCDTLASWTGSNAKPPTDWQTTSCSDACVALTIQLPGVTNTNGLKTLAVRGCHRDLIGYNIPTATTFSKKGKIQRYDALAKKQVDTDASLILCNTAATGTPLIPCNTPTTVTDVASSQLTCAVCDSTYHDCPKTPTSTCSGAYCTKTAGWVGNTWVETKGCSPFSVLSDSQPACAKVTTTAAFPTFLRSDDDAKTRARRSTITYEGETCFCNTNNCNNGAAGLTISALLVTIASAALLRA